jgi:hypothetical protein
VPNHRILFPFRDLLRQELRQKVDEDCCDDERDHYHAIAAQTNIQTTKQKITMPPYLKNASIIFFLLWGLHKS